jgi:hypothetical protein
MSKVISRLNHYVGINAHLNSALQQRDWDGFHGHLLSDLTRYLNDLVRPLGYLAKMQGSLQIRRLDTPDVRQPESDSLIWEVTPGRRPLPSPVSGQPVANTLQVPLREHLALPDLGQEQYFAVGIYARAATEANPVVWIEVLSPSNKRQGRFPTPYEERRLMLMQLQTLVFVEIDLLHETPPLTRSSHIGSYAANDPASHPYRIFVADTRVQFPEGNLTLYEFDVEQAIPFVSLPLKAGDQIDMNLAHVYNTTFYDHWFGDADYPVDYSTLPVNYDRYQPADQRRILARMLTVLDAKSQGMDLNALEGPLPIDEDHLPELLQSISPQYDLPTELP